MDLQTQYTLAFVRDVLPRPGRRVLEVGCGDGRLAAALLAAGTRVTAIDRDARAVGRAKARGVPAILADWLEFESRERYDAILFVRSLHHIVDLDGAVAHAAELLALDGCVIVHDFAVEGMDAATAEWFGRFVRSLAGAHCATNPDGGLIGALVSDEPPLEAWRRHHAHHGVIHTARDIAASLRRRFELVTEAAVPYLFRYLCESGDFDQSAEIVTACFEEEQRAVDGRAIRAIGRRFVARARTVIEQQLEGSPADEKP